MSTPITLFEYQKYDKEKYNLNVTDFNNLDSINKKHKGIFDIIWYKNRFTIKATSYVGVVKLQNLCIEVLPKIFKTKAVNNQNIETQEEPDQPQREKLVQPQRDEATRNLLYLLQYTKKLKIKEFKAPLQTPKKDNIFEVMIYIFARHLYDLLALGMNKTYMAVEDESRFLKGQWRLGEQLATKPHAKHLFFVRYDEFTEDNYLNRIFKYVARMLTVFSGDKQNKKLLDDILLIYADVTDMPAVSEADFLKVQFNRMNESFKPVFEYALFFIEGLSQQLLSGKKGTFSFMFDMNVLFEEFIAEFIKKEVLKDAKISYKPENMHIKPKAIFLANYKKENEKIENVFGLEPDIQFVKDNKTELIIDTKYKLLASEDEKKLGVSQGDMYQMFAYSHKYDCNRVVLLYPKHNNMEEKNAGHRRTFFLDDKNNDRQVQIWTVDLSIDLDNKEDKENLINQLKEIFIIN